jgi:predicted permease
MGWLPNAAKIYRTLLFAYPAEFRHEYGTEMERFFEERLRSEPSGRVWLETLADLPLSAVSEHVSILLDDLRYCSRTLSKSPGFLLTSVLTLALGIGATTTVFSIVNAMLFRSMPYRDPERLVNIWTPNSHFVNIPEVPPSNADFNDWQRLSHSFSALTQWSFSDAGLVTGSGASPVRVASVAGNFFSTMGVSPELGRTIDDNDDRPGHEHVAVISDRLWREFFAADANVIGRDLPLSREKYTIVGVMPARFVYPHLTDLARSVGGPEHTDMWIPAALTPTQKAERVNRNKLAIGRLRPGVELKQAQAELARIEAGLGPEYPPALRGWTVLMRSFSDTAIGPVRSMVLLLSGAVLLVLLIACANVANLMLARAAGRSAEHGVRTALGAGRLRLVRLILTEAFLVSLAGGIFGTALVFAGVEVIARLNPGNIPGVADASPDGRVLLFAIGLSAVSAILFGCVPAFAASRVDVVAFLKQGGRSITVASGRFRRALIALEVALSVILLVGAGLLIRSYIGLEAVDKGFDESTVVASITLDRGFYARPDQQAAFVRRLIGETNKIPGVESAGAVNIFPLHPNEPHCALDVKSHPESPRGPVDCRSATPGYFPSAGIRLLQGRFFNNADDATRLSVAIVSQTFAGTWFHGREALGQQIRVGGPAQPWSTIVGVVADTRHSTLEEKPRPALYRPFWQAPVFQAELTVRSRLSASDAASMIRRALRRTDPAVPAIEIRTVGEIISAANARRRFETSILGGFAAFAVLLALVGVYGLTLYTVGQRTAEIGIRMAVGGSRTRVVRMIVAQNLAPVAGGLIAGLAAASGLTRLLTALLYDVQPFDPMTYLLVPGFMLLVALAACLIPAWKAARIDPLTALRYE